MSGSKQRRVFFSPFCCLNDVYLLEFRYENAAGTKTTIKGRKLKQMFQKITALKKYWGLSLHFVMFVEEWNVHRPQQSIHLQFYRVNKPNKWSEERQRRQQWESQKQTHRLRGLSTRLFRATHTRLCISKCSGTPALLGGIKGPSKDAGWASMALTGSGCSVLWGYLAACRIL